MLSQAASRAPPAQGLAGLSPAMASSWPTLHTYLEHGETPGQAQQAGHAQRLGGQQTGHTTLLMPGRRGRAPLPPRPSHSKPKLCCPLDGSLVDGRGVPKGHVCVPAPRTREWGPDLEIRSLQM